MSTTNTTAKTMTMEEQIAKLMAENESLRKANMKAMTRGITFKVSEKGAVSVYGMGRFPVTLYAEQWDKLLANTAEIKAFMKANASKLSHKADGLVPAATVAATV